MARASVRRQKTAARRSPKRAATPSRAKKEETKYEVGDIIVANVQSGVPESEFKVPKTGTWHPCDGSELATSEHLELAKRIHGDAHVDATIDLPLLVNCYIRVK